jgi:hypothetical protein
VKALIIGAGIHGITIACELAKLNVDVVIIDSNHEILMGTSNGTHNRVNMGYHYPRSQETVDECYRGFEFFQRNLSSALYYPSSCYYAIDSSDSLVNAAQYRDFLKSAGLKYSCEYPSSDILIPDHIEESFRVWEPCYDVTMLRRIYHQKIENLSIKLALGFNIQSGKIDGKNVVLISDVNHQIFNKFDIIVNATYASTNNIQSVLGCQEPRKTYCYQKTEVVIATYDKVSLPAMTVMDGPFMTVLPYLQSGHRNKYAVYDVVSSIHEEFIGEFLPENFRTPQVVSKYEEMRVRGRKYFAFMNDLVPQTSLWALRPIPLTTLDNDSRVTNLIKHNVHDCFYSVLEGKFVSAPLQGQIISEILVQQASK